MCGRRGCVCLCGCGAVYPSKATPYLTCSLPSRRSLSPFLHTRNVIPTSRISSPRSALSSIVCSTVEHCVQHCQALCSTGKHCAALSNLARHVCKISHPVSRCWHKTPIDGFHGCMVKPSVSTSQFHLLMGTSVSRVRVA